MNRIFRFSLLLLLSLTAWASQAATPKACRDLNPKKQHIVFLISEDSLNYQAHLTIPIFAKTLEKQLDYRVTVLKGKGPNNAFSFPGLEAIKEADLIVLFSRRIALSHQQMSLFKEYLHKGGSLVALRTGNHAFTTRGNIPKGYEDWPEFVSEILGCSNQGYGPVALGTDVTVSEAANSHPILRDFNFKKVHSIGNLYRVLPLQDASAQVLLMGTAGSETEPIAWTRGATQNRIFYTTLGHPTDFSQNWFTQLLRNAIQWAVRE